MSPIILKCHPPPEMCEWATWENLTVLPHMADRKFGFWVRCHSNPRIGTGNTLVLNTKHLAVQAEGWWVDDITSVWLQFVMPHCQYFSVWTWPFKALISGTHSVENGISERQDVDVINSNIFLPLALCCYPLDTSYCLIILFYWSNDAYICHAHIHSHVTPPRSYYLSICVSKGLPP